ncbi:transglutaminase domain-containing protein [bacterium]|nr:transglutaminase domain-containing protein [bacterium]
MEHALMANTRDEIASYRLRDEIVVTDLPKGNHLLEVWIPVPQTDANQQVLEVSVESDADLSHHYDREWGNAIFYARLPSAKGFRAECFYQVERRPAQVVADPARSLSLRGTPPPYARYLAPEKHVRVDEETRKRALDLIGAEKNPLRQARIFYDHVTGYMTYDQEKQSWKGSTDHALVCQVGNCNDIHALYLSLCRSVGIPARLVMGFALEGEDQCDLCGYHCWAETYVGGLGWLPVDASCACRYGHAGFGSLDLNHVAFSRGRDLLLEPAQRGDRLLFFPSAYAEVDGAAFPGVERHLRFDRIGTAA